MHEGSMHASVLFLTIAEADDRYSDGRGKQGAKLTGGGEISLGQFGYSVMLPSDGSTALIGGACMGDRTFCAVPPDVCASRGRFVDGSRLRLAAVGLHSPLGRVALARCPLSLPE
jgi:hypothetical protein